MKPRGHFNLKEVIVICKPRTLNVGGEDSVKSWKREIRRYHNDAFFFDLSICRLIIAIVIRVHPNKDHLVQ